MDFLKSLLGMFTSSVLRLAVSVSVLVAAYFFCVQHANGNVHRIQRCGRRF